MEHRLPFSTSAAGEARKLSRDFLHSRLDEARASDFMLMISEIVGNAVRHGEPERDGQIGLRLEADAAVVRAVVTDAGPEFEYDREAFDRADLNHVGLVMVDRLADRWGLSLDGKKAVWFEVDRGAISPKPVAAYTVRSGPSPRGYCANAGSSAWVYTGLARHKEVSLHAAHRYVDLPSRPPGNEGGAGWL